LDIIEKEARMRLSKQELENDEEFFFFILFFLAKMKATENFDRFLAAIDDL